MPAPFSDYCGRFAPSPTGALHIGSLVSALASYLDARAHRGRWLLRIEDVDGPRTQPGAAGQILDILQRYGMHADAPPVWQSRNEAAYAAALEQLSRAGWIYPCGCTRKEIADSLANQHERHTTLAYPGTCRHGLRGRPARAWRVRVPGLPAGDAAGAGDQSASAAQLTFIDRWQGAITQNLATEVGDFVLKRADGLWAYQLAVVVDDAQAHVSDIVRGADLLDSTARQIYLQHLLGLPTPAYLHVPVVTNEDGEKLSKQTGALALDAQQALPNLMQAAHHLGLAISADSIDGFYREATAAWAALHLRETPEAR